jgi:hypothetical protein
MTFSGDPFRILGLSPSASDAEIKRAYRALAKRYHPDSAGEKALPRFLAIQAAYDVLTQPGRHPPATTTRPTRSPGSSGAGPGTRGRTAGPTRPPEDRAAPDADPGRARATRDAYRSRRSRPGPASGPTSGPAWWAAGRPGAPGSAMGRDDQADPRRPPGAAGERGAPGSPAAGAPGWRSSTGPNGRRGRPPKVATLGSTSYDDAPRDPEPEWNGATWYGDSSGTYWTINPKEYADPRKHGPEYLARAQRGAPAGRGGSAGPAPTPFDDGTPDPDTDPPAAGAWSPGPSAPGEGGRQSRTSSPPGPPADGPGPAYRPSRRARAAAWTTSAAGNSSRTAASGATSRVAFDATPSTSRGDDGAARSLEAAPPQRVLLALIAWPPLGLAAALVIGELTGCARAAATCSEPESLLGWLVQPAIVALLLLLPIVARPAAVASVAVGVASIGAAAVLSVVGGARAPGATVSAPPAAATLLLAILVMAYVVGLIGSLSGRLPVPPWLREPTEGGPRPSRP